MVMDTCRFPRLISGTRVVKERGFDGRCPGGRHWEHPWMIVTPTEPAEVGQGFGCRGGVIQAPFGAVIARLGKEHCVAATAPIPQKVAMKMVTVGPAVTTCSSLISVIRWAGSVALHETQWEHQSQNGKCVASGADRSSGVGSPGFRTTRADRSSMGNSSSILLDPQAMQTSG